MLTLFTYLFVCARCGMATFAPPIFCGVIGKRATQSEVAMSYSCNACTKTCYPTGGTLTREQCQQVCSSTSTAQRCDAHQGCVADADGSYPCEAECNTSCCFCTHGTVASSKDCPTKQSNGQMVGGEVCARCDSGYVLNKSQVCVKASPSQKTCTCANGTAATGDACPTDNTEKCSTCNPGYHIDDIACAANQCKCANGTAATGTACTSNGAEVCVSCAKDFLLDGVVCKKNTTPPQCTCANGKPATGEQCTSNGAEVCASCYAGYTLQNGTCTLDPKTFACTNGTCHPAGGSGSFATRQSCESACADPHPSPFVSPAVLAVTVAVVVLVAVLILTHHARRRREMM